MRTQIDVFGMLSRVGAGTHRDLVTRATGRAVRSSIEMELAQLTGLTVVVLDFSSVRLMDCSCADEVVAKLVQASLAEAGAPAIFLIRGLDEHKAEEVAEVLKRHQLALVAEAQGSLQLLGDVADRARLAFHRLAERGRTGAADLAADLSWPLEQAESALNELAGRRLVMREDQWYQCPNVS